MNKQLLLIRLSWLASTLCLYIGSFSTAAQAQQQSLGLPTQLWKSNAPTCLAIATKPSSAFPSKENCDDGDSTLFNGLLCSVGINEGCDAVKLSQDVTGRWHRSPRLAADPSLRPQNSFSPDMAVGVQLYLLATRDSNAARRWVSWLESNTPCLVQGPQGCSLKSPLPRFCTDDTEKGCTLRPGDAALLAMTLRAVDALPAEGTIVGNYIRPFEARVVEQVLLASLVNESGFPRHLAAAGILNVLRAGALTDGAKAQLSAASEALAQKEPKNAFFLTLARRPTLEVHAAISALCPKTVADLPKQRSQWTWEREDSEMAWRESVLWDCLFAWRLSISQLQ